MAHAGISSAQVLPRFLLPRLSWHGQQLATAQKQSIRALSTALPTYTTSPKTTRNSTASRPFVCSSHDVLRRSKYSMLQNPAHHRAFHATARQSRDHHFDTLKFVQRLKEEGFTEAQAVAMMRVLSDVIEERFAPLLCVQNLAYLLMPVFRT